MRRGSKPVVYAHVSLSFFFEIFSTQFFLDPPSSGQSSGTSFSLFPCSRLTSRVSYPQRDRKGVLRSCVVACSFADSLGRADLLMIFLGNNVRSRNQPPCPWERTVSLAAGVSRVSRRAYQLLVCMIGHREELCCGDSTSPGATWPRRRPSRGMRLGLEGAHLKLPLHPLHRRSQRWEGENWLPCPHDSAPARSLLPREREMFVMRTEPLLSFDCSGGDSLTGVTVEASSGN